MIPTRTITLSLLLFAFPCFVFAQDSLQVNAEDAKWVEQVLAEHGADFNKELAQASIGEIKLAQGLWLNEGDTFFGGELLTFEAIALENGVELVWNTAKEVNSEYFAVERLQADNQFATISILPASRKSTSLKTYQFVDELAKPGNNVYRLKQVDFNGQSLQTEPISIQYGTEGFLSVSTSEDAQTLDIQTDIKMVKIKITDKEGKVLVKADKEDASFARIDIAKLKPGEYDIMVEDGDQVRVMKFKKKK